MKRYNIKKSGIAIIVFIIMILLILLGRERDPFKAVKEMRKNIDEYELISTKHIEEGIFLYSAGVVNKGRDNMYFVDMVKKTITGYKWIDGGGHINRWLPDGEDYVISMQLLNEEKNITPTAIGIISDENVLGIKVNTLAELSVATIYKGRDESERFYVLNFEKDIADLRFMTINLAYTDDSNVEFTTRGEEMERLQEGRVLYFDEEDIESIKK